MSLTLSDINRSRATAHYQRAGEVLKLPKVKAKRVLKPLPPLERFVDATRAQPKDEWRRIVLPWPPSINEMYPIAARGGRAMKYLSPEGKQYKAFVENLILLLGMRPISGLVYVVVDLYRPRKIGDADNYQKSAFDSIKGFAYHDDGQIEQFLVRRHDDANFPRAEIAIRLAAGETLNLGLFPAQLEASR